ncbi:hypothetical protein RUM44_000538 [Polyplax serrata]|uniref:Uncharacterized protein n=1 Tax=Polyplax serrata TaxID=468196 RepID=A0ABR1B5Q1_POLSC
MAGERTSQEKKKDEKVDEEQVRQEENRQRAKIREECQLHVTSDIKVKAKNDTTTTEGGDFRLSRRRPSHCNRNNPIVWDGEEQEASMEKPKLLGQSRRE